MHLSITDPNVSMTMNGFLIIANIINIVYNIPQMVLTYKTKSTGDFSFWFLSLRVVGNTIWLIYAIDIDSLLMLINNTVTVGSSIFILFFKVKKYYEERLDKGPASDSDIIMTRLIINAPPDLALKAAKPRF